jgi:hypothetical protein
MPISEGMDRISAAESGEDRIRMLRSFPRTSDELTRQSNCCGCSYHRKANFIQRGKRIVSQ